MAREELSSEKEMEEAKRQKIAESNKAWLSEYAPRGKEEDFLQRFKEEWEKIKDLKEKVGLERAQSELIQEICSLSFGIKEAINDKNLTSLHSNLEAFKDILEKSFDVDLEKQDLTRIESKREWHER